MKAVISNEITREGYEKLKAELEYLITVERKENAERLKDAISLGDISENAEYDSAKEAQAATEERIKTIEEIFRTVRVVEIAEDAVDNIQTGCTIVFEDIDLKKTYTYKLVGSTESDPLYGRLSNASPVGQAMTGHRKGDKVVVHAPDGMIEYRVLDVH